MAANLAHADHRSRHSRVIPHRKTNRRPRRNQSGSHPPNHSCLSLEYPQRTRRNTTTRFHVRKPSDQLRIQHRHHNSRSQLQPDHPAMVAMAAVPPNRPSPPHHRRKSPIPPPHHHQPPRHPLHLHQNQPTRSHNLEPQRQPIPTQLAELPRLKAG